MAIKLHGRAPRVYAWAIETNGRWQLCYWTEPTKAALIARGKPSPEAKIVRVWLSLENINRADGGEVV